MRLSTAFVRSIVLRDSASIRSKLEFYLIEITGGKSYKSKSTRARFAFSPKAVRVRELLASELKVQEPASALARKQ
jgi:hypothetical protein